MKGHREIACAAAILIFFSASNLYPYSGPFDGRNFKGRIAFSSDGNYNDEDDWGAFPVAIAILDSFGVTDKLVHVDYGNILPKNDPRFYREMAESVLGSADRYNISRSILFDCQKDLDGAIDSITNAINASSADNPLYYILAGPMEVPFRGIEKSDPDKRKYVYCISHSGWNDGYTRNDQELHAHNKRDVIPSGINWIQCRDGNRNLAHPSGVGRKSTPEQWSLYHWLRDSGDSRLRWIFTRLEAEGRADISDSTMTYFLLTGDEDANLAKLKSLLDAKNVPAPTDPRKYVRIEAENFRILDNYVVEHRNDRRASHRLSVRLASIAAGRIRTSFHQPYTVDSGRYDVDIRYFDEEDGRCRFGLYVNGVQEGSAWYASKDGKEWTTHTIEDVAINSGDEVMVVVHGNAGEYGKLDYVQLNYRSPQSDASGSRSSAFSSSGHDMLSSAGKGAADNEVRRGGLSVEQARRWRSAIRSALLVPDPLPQLAVKTHGRFEPATGVVAERVSYATQFEMRVPAIVYSPRERRRELPALVIVNGHGGDKYSWYAFYSGVLYARAGAVVLTYDPIGEGERNRQRKSGTRAHDTRQQPRQMGQRLGGLMVTDLMQAVSYLSQRPDVDPERIAACGYSMGSFVLAVTGVVDERLHACVLVGGGNLDGRDGYWDNSKPMCQGIPYQSLVFLGDRPAAIYALHAMRGPTLVFNGLQDTVVAIPTHGRPFFENLQDRVAQLLGTREGILETGFVAHVSHRPFFVTEPVALWLERHLDFPLWTPETIRTMPTTHISEWVKAENVAVDARYASEEREGGLRALGAGVPGLSRSQLSVFTEEQWERQKDRLIYEAWVRQAKSRIEHKR